MALVRRYRVNCNDPRPRIRKWVFGLPAAFTIATGVPAVADEGERGEESRHQVIVFEHGPQHHGEHGPNHHDDGPPSDRVPSVAPAAPAHDGGEESSPGIDQMSTAEAISAALRAGELGDHAIAVWHDDGRVSLDGRVASERAKFRAERLARSVSGVRDVENRLRVDLGEADRANAGPPRHDPPKDRPASKPPAASKVVGDVTVNVEVRVNVLSGNTENAPSGPQGPRDGGEGPPRPSLFDRIPEELRPPRRAGGPDQERLNRQETLIRELSEQVKRLQAELDEMRRQGGPERDRPGAARRDFGPSRERFEHMRENLRRRAEEARDRLQQQLQSRGEPRHEEGREDDEAERSEEAEEEQEEEAADEAEEPSEDRRAAIEDLLPALQTLFEGPAEDEY